MRARLDGSEITTVIDSGVEIPGKCEYYSTATAVSYILMSLSCFCFFLMKKYSSLCTMGLKSHCEHSITNSLIKLCVQA